MRFEWFGNTRFVQHAIQTVFQCESNSFAIWLEWFYNALLMDLQLRIEWFCNTDRMVLQR